MRNHLVAIATLLALPVLAPSRAHAGHPPIVLESYVGERPDDAEVLLSPLIDELAKNKFVIGPDVVGRQFEATASRPAVAGGLPKNFVDELARGHDRWANGKFDEAVPILGPLVEAARANTGEFAQNQNRALHPQLQRALIALAMSQLKLGDRSAAKQTMGEALRGDPNLKISRGMYGQEASELYDEVFRQLFDRGLGKVIIVVDAEGAGIYVNERLLEMGRLEMSLPPGEYRVVARIGNDVSRAHRVVVKGGDIHKLTIEPAFDQVVHTGPGWTGLRFPSSAERARDELRHAAAFGAAIDADQVIVLGIDTVNDRRTIKGALVNKVSGREFRSGSIPLDANPSTEQRRNLARFLIGGPATPDIIDYVRSDREAGGAGPIARAERRAGPAPAPPWGGWKWITGGAAVAAGVAGGVILSYHGKCSADVAPGVPCPNHHETAAPGWTAIGGAAALAGVTVYLVLRERRGGGGAPRTAYVAPTAGGALAGYAARF